MGQMCPHNVAEGVDNGGASPASSSCKAATRACGVWNGFMPSSGGVEWQCGDMRWPETIVRWAAARAPAHLEIYVAPAIEGIECIVRTCPSLHINVRGMALKCP